MNSKEKGEKALRIVIGEVAKYDVGCATLLSDNEPYDIILIYKGKLFKAQVKSSSFSESENSVTFSVCTSNWHKKITKKYKKGDFDVMIFVDMRNYSIYMAEAEKCFDRKSFSIRTAPANNGQEVGCNMSKDYVLSQDRINKLLI